MALSEVVKKIRKEIIENRKDRRYKIGAYEFVLNGMEFYYTVKGEKRHFSGEEITKGLLLFAVKQYGPLAREVLREWGINSTDDIGNIVYNLIEIGIMSKQKEDKIEEFYNVINLDEYFTNQEYFFIDKQDIKKIKGT